MSTPFDDVVENIASRRYHNHRLEDHSDIVSDGVYRDLLRLCPYLKGDVDLGTVRHWENVQAPGARNRRIDLFIGEPNEAGLPDLSKLRICVENKSVITAHRNRDARFDDLNETMQVVHGARPDAVIAATVMIGTAPRTLNVPDHVKKAYRDRMHEFERAVLPRLSSGDASLWTDFPYAMSSNRAQDPARTLTKLRSLPTRKPGHTHVAGYDALVFAPVFVDNVSPPYVDRRSNLGVDVDGDYAAMIESICRAYKARWHT